MHKGIHINLTPPFKNTLPDQVKLEPKVLENLGNHTRIKMPLVAARATFPNS